MAREHEDPRAAHYQIAADLRVQIMSGELPPGTQLPITSALIEHYGVANQTIQRALQILKDEGYIVGRHGRGVFVRDRHIQSMDTVATMYPSTPGESYAWISAARRQGKVGVNRILKVAEVPPPAEVRRAFLLGEGATVAMRHRLLLLNDEPAELVWSYYPIDLARGTALLEPGRIKGGSPTLLAEMGYPPREMVDEVTARVTSTKEYVLLELPADVSVLRIFRVVYSDHRRPIEATVSVKAGHLNKLLYRVPLG